MNITRTVLLAMILFTSGMVHAAEMKFNFINAEITDVIAEYSKASGQRFLVDPSVRGKVTIFNPKPVSLDEAFNQLSSALAVNGLGISKQGEVMHVLQARTLQRNYIEVINELPPLRPEKMVTWVIQLKYASADEINKQLRILTSKDGELVPYSETNQLLVSDWVSNLHRVAKIVELVDKPATKTPKAAKKSI